MLLTFTRYTVQVCKIVSDMLKKNSIIISKDDSMQCFATHQESRPRGNLTDQCMMHDEDEFYFDFLALTSIVLLEELILFLLCYNC